jgi:hypothetical protein
MTDHGEDDRAGREPADAGCGDDSGRTEQLIGPLDEPEFDEVEVADQGPLMVVAE